MSAGFAGMASALVLVASRCHLHRLFSVHIRIETRRDEFARTDYTSTSSTNSATWPPCPSGAARAGTSISRTSVTSGPAIARTPINAGSANARRIGNGWPVVIAFIVKWRVDINRRAISVARPPIGPSGTLRNIAPRDPAAQPPEPHITPRPAAIPHSYTRTARYDTYCAITHTCSAAHVDICHHIATPCSLRRLGKIKENCGTTYQ